MKTITNQAAQGDLYIRRVAQLPVGAREVAPTGGRHVVAHSETGHDHFVDAGVGVGFYEHSDPLVCYLRVETPIALLVHAREYDTHESLGLPTGLYEVRRQQELTPSGWRQVVD